MKFALLAVTLLALVASNEAFFGRFGRFGRFGMGGLGFGRFGMMGMGFGFPGLPVPMPVPVPVPVPMPVPFGKRSIEFMNETETSCTIESFFGSNSTLMCTG